MPRILRFHLDEHVDAAVADGLRRRGIDVTTTSGACLLGATDDAHVAFANEQGRVIFTNDDDFLRIHRRGDLHPGIVYCQQQSRSVGEIIRTSALVWEVLEPDEMRNRVEFA